MSRHHKNDSEDYLSTPVLCLYFVLFLVAFSCGFSLDPNIGSFEDFWTWSSFVGKPGTWLIELFVRTLMGFLLGAVVIGFTAPNPR